MCKQRPRFPSRHLPAPYAQLQMTYLLIAQRQTSQHVDVSPRVAIDAICSTTSRCCSCSPRLWLRGVLHAHIDNPAISQVCYHTKTSTAQAGLRCLQHPTEAAGPCYRLVNSMPRHMHKWHVCCMSPQSSWPRSHRRHNRLQVPAASELTSTKVQQANIGPAHRQQHCTTNCKPAPSHTVLQPTPPCQKAQQPIDEVTTAQP